MIRLLPLLLILLLNVLCLTLFIKGELTFYIHPRYILFTAVMNAICFIIAALAVITVLKSTDGKPWSFLRKRPAILSIVTALLIICGIVLPPKPLLSAMVDQRLTQTQQLSTCQKISDQPPTTFQHWHQLLATCDDPFMYRGEKITVEGFIYKHHDVQPDEAFYIARFMVSCCAVDATPLLILVKSAKDIPATNEWVRVEGTVQPMRINGRLTAVIEPERLQHIPQPNQPYEFLEL